MRHLRSAVVMWVPLMAAATAWAQQSVPSAGTSVVEWGPTNIGLPLAPVVSSPPFVACPQVNPSPACRPQATAPARPSAQAAPPARQSARATPPPRPPKGPHGYGPLQGNGMATGNGHGNDHAGPPNQAQGRAVQQAAMGDLFGGRIIPPDILKILSDRRIEPIAAYLLWQAARKPIEEWTMRQLQDLTSTLPTLIEAGIPLPQVQALYKFLELDPNEVFNPQFGQGWQARSTRFDPASSAAVAEISSADCQTDPGMMTVATFRSCTTAVH